MAEVYAIMVDRRGCGGYFGGFPGWAPIDLRDAVERGSRLLQQ
ncbi:hypothetical protein NB231_07772 [Nitrococcus mobilis Nb-231]|uniref:Uncharacterized protein n=1 Tax=Nitrococcus mobilis Nb-231 TaxID=314278 RepID=A4BTE9_9GAMM|nr:hypothetical protein NB231_07772 [Nitrococcus mobilis Nb-231]